MAQTQNFGWEKPTNHGSLGQWGAMLNAIIDAIDSVLYAVQSTANAAMAKAGGVFSGLVTNKSDAYVAVNKGNMSGAVSFDLSAGNVFYGTVTGNCTFSFTNAPSDASFIVLELTNAGAHTITWPAGTRWPGGSPPTFSTSGVDVVTIYRRGSNLRAALVQKDSR